MSDDQRREKRGGADQTAQPKQRQQTLRDQSLAEWATLGASVLILALVLGALAYFYFSDTAPQAPTIEVRPRIDQIREATDAFYLPVEVINHGVQTASDVSVQLTLSDRDGASESVSFTVPFLPGGATLTRVAVYQKDPALGTLSHVFTFARP